MTEFEATARRVLAEERERVVRPWRRLTFWLLGGYGVMIVLSAVQFLMWLDR